MRAGDALIVGIDLGTTNSAVAVWKDGAARLIPNSLGHTLTPSVVSVDDDGSLLVGLPARERIATHPGRTAFAFKRYMGSTRETRLAEHSLLPEELSSLVLKSLKADAEAFLGEAVTEAVITVPAYFNDKQRKATRRAGELAGLKVERLLNEPTAAALAYGIHERGAEAQFLVFDLGGGTFDVSILELFEGVIEVRASTGDNRLGGEDFNAALVQLMRQKFAREWSKDKEDPALLARLNVAAEQTRRALTERSEAAMSLIWNEQSFEHTVTTEAFEHEAEPLLKRLREPVLRALRDSGVRAETLNEVVMVGGATRMPVVRRAVTRMFGRFPANTVNPDEAVAVGAAIQGGLKGRHSDLREVVLTDVCPYTLGVDTTRVGPGGQRRSGFFAPIIERNTVVPASRSHSFTTLEDNQLKVRFRIYQGEARLVADNILLGEIEVPVPRAKAGQVEIDCRFSYDINGLLEVDVSVPQTGERRELVIVEDDAVTPAELEMRRAALAKLKQHPRDDDANRAAMARAERCFEDHLGDARDHIGRLIERFEAALDSQDPRTVETARAELLTALDSIEGETWL
ncbi:Hsp70 family protein [Caulobacter sp. KR2-114]|uniref:Hsp70 family protein n=1 Tax=Caulobacter sp. KR2-114 TaxID=3400912 RepID=UPI003C2D250C